MRAHVRAHVRAPCCVRATWSRSTATAPRATPSECSSPPPPLPASLPSSARTARTTRPSHPPVHTTASPSSSLSLLHPSRGPASSTGESSSSSSPGNLGMSRPSPAGGRYAWREARASRRTGVKATRDGSSRQDPSSPAWREARASRRTGVKATRDGSSRQDPSSPLRSTGWLLGTVHGVWVGDGSAPTDLRSCRCRRLSSLSSCSNCTRAHAGVIQPGGAQRAHTASAPRYLLQHHVGRLV